jgi:peptidoglycan/LPS O-acetylase OafA/YrhL
VNPNAKPVAVPRNPRYSSLDIWRGVACLMIVVIHACFYVNEEARTAAARAASPVGSFLINHVASRFGIGVHIFFVISGYCIAATADATRRKSGSIVQYFGRRFRRIFPPYWAALAFTAVTAVVVWAAGRPTLVTDAESPIPHPAQLTPAQWAGNLTLTETWLQHFFPDPYQLQLGPSWSLCYEEQFYLVCGLVLLCARRHFFAGVAAVTLVNLCLVPVLLGPAARFGAARSAVQGFFFDGRWFLFAAGVFVYYLLNYAAGRSRRRLLAGLWLLVAGAVVFRYAVLPRWGSWDQRNQDWEFVAGFTFALLLVLLHPHDAWMCGRRWLAPLAWCGRMCYSLYLIHWPVTKVLSHALFLAGVSGVWPTLAVTVPACILASVAFAWAFYLMVERRFLNPPSVWAPASRPAPVSAEVKATPAWVPETPPVPQGV